ncbi:MAG: glucokinase [Candidatus Dadabacteria bacterium]|nr:glucokinase [Candidatus Dadabacteria bacterium]
MILAGDIGGTKTTLAYFRIEAGQLKTTVESTFSSREHGSLREIARKFVSTNSLRIEHACFGVAGPVKEGRSETTNLPWVVDSKVLSVELGIETAWLINDLEATAYGIKALEPKDFTILNNGASDAKGNAAVIAAGTGLGEAGFYWDGENHHPFACEGGHADFAPRNELEMELLRHLLERYSHVSYERVLSGPGLFNIYSFLRDKGSFGKEPRWLTEKISRGDDPSSAVSEAALEGACELCVKALDTFVSIYGAEAGNLALKTLATGGVYVGGGIAPKIIKKLTDGTFINAFFDKGRLENLMKSMPVSVILNEKTPLLGSARYAALRSGRSDVR